MGAALLSGCTDISSFNTGCKSQGVMTKTATVLPAPLSGWTGFILKQNARRDGLALDLPPFIADSLHRACPQGSDVSSEEANYACTFPDIGNNTSNNRYEQLNHNHESVTSRENGSKQFDLEIQDEPSHQFRDSETERRIAEDDTVGITQAKHDGLDNAFKMQLVDRCYSGCGSGSSESGFYTPVGYEASVSSHQQQLSSLDFQSKGFKRTIWGIEKRSQFSSLDASASKMAEYEGIVERLKNEQGHIRLSAAMAVRSATRFSSEARKNLRKAGAIPPLLDLLQDSSLGVSYMAAMALLNLAIGSIRNKEAMFDCGAIPILVRLLGSGSAPSLRESATAVIMSLAASDQLKPCIGTSGAVPCLVDLLTTGTAQGRSDALRALLNLSIFKGNRSTIVEAGAVDLLFNIILSDGKEIAEKALLLLSYLYMSKEGREAIASAKVTCSALLQILKHGSFSQACKEQTVGMLVSLSADTNVRRMAVSALGILPAIMEIALLGSNPRAQEKATKLLRIIKEHRADEGIVFHHLPADDGRSEGKESSGSVGDSPSSIGLVTRISENGGMSCGSLPQTGKRFASLRSFFVRGFGLDYLKCRSVPIHNSSSVPSKLLNSICS